MRNELKKLQLDNKLLKDKIKHLNLVIDKFKLKDEESFVSCPSGMNT